MTTVEILNKLGRLIECLEKAEHPTHQDDVCLELMRHSKEFKDALSKAARSLS